MLGVAATDEPVAEAWWGAHDSGPSRLDAEGLPLDELIAREPAGMLGESAAEHWGPRLPYLLKVLSIGKPLSIQVHPTLDQARTGFSEEQRGTGGAPHHFLDPFHKPEMVVAVTPMEILAGVRPVRDTAIDLRSLETVRASELADILEAAGDIRAFIHEALSAGVGPDTLDALARAGQRADAGSSLAAAARTLHHFPGDAGAVVALGMHRVALAPGESLFVGAGVLHSYQSGLGLEIMANSDNVVRAGLTPKPVNVPLLLELLEPRECAPALPTVHSEGAARHLVTEAQEFALTIVTEGRAQLPAAPRIVLALNGEATLHCDDDRIVLEPGKAAFVPHHCGVLDVTTSGQAVVARTPWETERHH